MKINVYNCPSGHPLITKDCEPSQVTPASIMCPVCHKTAWSTNYRDQDQNLRPNYEWFVPTNWQELKAATLEAMGSQAEALTKEDYESMIADIQKGRSNCNVMYRIIQP